MKKMSFERMIMAVTTTSNKVELELLKGEAKNHSECTNIIGDYLYRYGRSFIILSAYTLDGEIKSNVMHDMSLSDDGCISYDTGNKLQKLSWARAILNNPCLASTTGQAPSDSVKLAAIKQLRIL